VSFYRLVFYSAMIGGWAAFLGWFFSELLLLQRSTDAGILVIFITTALVGAFIAGGLMLLGGVANGTFQGQWQRLLPGLAGGFVAGAVGGLVGNLIYLVFRSIVVRIIGWTIMGLAIGAVEGLYDRSPRKIRNGLIGGAVGGFLGGLFFDRVAGVVGGVMSSRAASFVILGICIGCFVGLAQVILKEAWLTVEAGFRPGRQLVLSMPEIVMGTSEKAALPFIAFGAQGVEPVHLRIVRREDGSYLLQDNHSRTGSFVNGQHVQGAVVLRNNDVIQLGVNLVRFREVHRHVANGDENRRTDRDGQRPCATPLPPRAVSPSPPPAAQGVTAALPKAHPVLPTAQPTPSPIVARPPAVKPASPSPAAARPPARPVPVTPAAPVPPAVAATPSAMVGCPICGRPGTAVPQSGKRRCVSCGINF
jgi:hypothetical protein